MAHPYPCTIIRAIPNATERTVFFLPWVEPRDLCNPERKLLIKDFQFNLSPPTWKKSLKNMRYMGIYGNIWNAWWKPKVFKPQEEGHMCGDSLTVTFPSEAGLVGYVATNKSKEYWNLPIMFFLKPGCLVSSSSYAMFIPTNMVS